VKSNVILLFPIMNQIISIFHCQ